ncbi:hypothetical protein [Desulfovibrio inopinatus]|uniref:AbiTii domain-containing protein n=1 Tax=Desulfovibrio inopinatus TaxID=102109 RepID=UPI00040F98B6|nr:hypothetical protein [Desulfovibrio inopinatus]
MPALVRELVNTVFDNSVSTTNLLRRALVVACRLEIPELAEWLRKELNGYGENETGVPEYRRVQGQLMADTPRGLLPVRIEFSATNKFLTERFMGQSIPELIQITQISTDIYIRPQFDDEQMIIQKIFTPSGIYGHPKVKLSSLDLTRIIETVRTKVLEWALDLESKGILGENMTFTQEEKQIVQEQHYHFGNVSGSQIQIESNGSTQTQPQTSGDTASLTALIQLLDDALQQGRVTEEHRAELEAELATLQAQAKSPKPKWTIIKETASSLRGILENAVGSVLASQALPYVAALSR